MLQRCPLCQSRNIEPTRRVLRHRDGRPITYPAACAACGLLIDPERCHGLAGALARWSAAGRVDAALGCGFGMDAYTLRMASTLFQQLFEPLGDSQAKALAFPHSEHPGCGALIHGGGAATADISLGYLCRPDAVDAILAGAAVHLAWAREIVLLCDGTARVPAPMPKGVRIVYRPLDGHFGDQRNALQDLAVSDWILQLDADETFRPEAGPFLRALAAHASAQDIASIGLPRRNFVDGVLSDVFPDTQYRLNRRAVRFAGRVHERPDRPWQRSMISLNGAIEHHLSRRHVVERSHRYDRMAPGQGRLEEEAALLLPYRD